MNKYKILRPPIQLHSFSMPSKEEIEKLKIGSIVKVIFAEKGRISERMWCKIIDATNDGWITAKLNNVPLNISLRKGDIVKFHITDVIDIWDE